MGPLAAFALAVNMTLDPASNTRPELGILRNAGDTDIEHLVFLALFAIIIENVKPSSNRGNLSFTALNIKATPFDESQRGLWRHERTDRHSNLFKTFCGLSQALDVSHANCPRSTAQPFAVFSIPRSVESFGGEHQRGTSATAYQLNRSKSCPLLLLLRALF